MESYRDADKMAVNLWRETRAASGRFGCSLRIHTCREDESWLSAMRSYWNDKLPGLTRVNSSPIAVVFKGNLPGDTQILYFKRFLMRDWCDVVKHVFRRSRAEREVNGIKLARSIGIKTPSPLCVIEERFLSQAIGSALISCAVLNVESLAECLKDASLTFSVKKELMESLGREVARWHNAGLCHGDMRSGNVLCRCDEAGIDFYWLDNERSRKVKSVKEQARNLMQLNMTRDGVNLTDRMRFWRAYVAEAGYDREQADKMLKIVIEWTRKRWQGRGWCQ